MGRVTKRVLAVLVVLVAAWWILDPSRAGGEREVRRVFPADARWVLEAPDTFEFMTLDPSHEDRSTTRPDALDGYRILGSGTVDDVTRRKMVEGMYEAVRRGEMHAGCFNPRHGIVAARGGKRLRILICFECFGILVFTGDAQTGESAAISDGPKGVFEEAARRAGLATAPL